MNAELLKQLQTAWTATQERVGTPQMHSNNGPSIESVSLSVGDLDAVKAAGVAINRCVCHLPPFDAIEEPDQRRPGHFRSSCRLCGAFLGYRLGSVGLSLNNRS